MKKILLLAVTLLGVSMVQAESYLESENPSTYYSYDKEWRPSGYRGFIDICNGGDLNLGGYVLDVATSHGYQINPHIFVGGGIGVTYHAHLKQVAVPIFSNVRFSFLDGQITPFVDLRGGLSPVENTGGYFAAGLGCHLSLTEKLAVNASLRYNIQQYGYNYDHHHHYNHSETDFAHGLSFNIGFEF